MFPIVAIHREGDPEGIIWVKGYHNDGLIDQIRLLTSKRNVSKRHISLLSMAKPGKDHVNA